MYVREKMFKERELNKIITIQKEWELEDNTVIFLNRKKQISWQEVETLIQIHIQNFLFSSDYEKGLIVKQGHHAAKSLQCQIGKNFFSATLNRDGLFHLNINCNSCTYYKDDILIQIFEMLWNFQTEGGAITFIERLSEVKKSRNCAIGLLLMFCLYCLQRKSKQKQLLFDSSNSYETFQNCHLFYHQVGFGPENQISYAILTDFTKNERFNLKYKTLRLICPNKGCVCIWNTVLNEKNLHFRDKSFATFFLIPPLVQIIINYLKPSLSSTT